MLRRQGQEMHGNQSGYRLLLFARLFALLCLPLPVRAAVPTYELAARIVAAGIPGVGGVRQIGMFHTGGAITSNPEFLVQTRSGHVLDPERVLVTSLSNFGAPLADPTLSPGSVLSIDTRAETTIVIPPNFAATGNQAIAVGGAVRLYTAQSPAFLNRYYNRGAQTANLPAVAGPRYISVNNAFGRPWFANAPSGVNGLGTNTVLDPNGRPLDNAPSAHAGGVFAGINTNRLAQFTQGDLLYGAMGTSFLGVSPDASGFAVFAVIKADGSIVQVHVKDGVDGLAPPGTISPLLVDTTDKVGLIGVAFKWSPRRTLFVADKMRNKIVTLELGDDTRQFVVNKIAYLSASELNQPVDLAATIPEVANPRFASHTTLAGGSDLYIVNRGDGTLLRMNQAGQVMARARIRVPGMGVLGADQLRGIAVSSDTQRIWLTFGGPVGSYPPGVLIEVSAFDESGPRQESKAQTLIVTNPDRVKAGEKYFVKKFTPAEGLGPLFNARSCVTCHSQPAVGGMSDHEENFVLRVAQMDSVSGRVSPIHDRNSPVARRHSIRELGELTAPRARIPKNANITSIRMPPTLFDLGLLEQVSDEAILAHAHNKGDGVYGRPNRVTTARGEEHIGRYGWKAGIAHLDEMVANAFVNELGISSPLAGIPQGRTGDDNKGNEENRNLIEVVTAYLKSLHNPLRPQEP